MKTTLTISAAFLMGAVLAGILLRQTGEESAVHSAGSTYGQILVDSPEVYTRERMVNDRFRQEAWLLEALNRDSMPNIQGQLGTSRSKTLNADLSLSPNASEKQRSQEPSTRSNGSGLSGGNHPESTVSQPPQLSAIEIFRSRQAYREEIRNAIIENQLDDRHDLQGNTLYRLKFDATVIPGNDTSTWGRVKVRFENRLANDKEQLKSIYNDWVAAVEEKINSRIRDEVSRVRDPALEAERDKETFAAILLIAQEILNDIDKEILLPATFTQENYTKLICSLRDNYDCRDELDCISKMIVLAELKRMNISFRKVGGVKKPAPSLDAFSELLENDFVEIKLDSDSRLVKIVSKESDGLNAFHKFLKPSVFAYAVTPRESTQQISSASQLAIAEQIRATASTALGTHGAAFNAESSSLFSEYARFLDARPIVVGIVSYSHLKNLSEAPPTDGTMSKSIMTSTANSKIGNGNENVNVAARGFVPSEGQFAEFGWLIGPKLVVGAKGLGVYRHHPSQNSLAALISVPSWWRRADITIETDWLDKNGDPLKRGEITRFEVTLPGDEEALLTFMLLGGKRPAPKIDEVERFVTVSSDGERKRAEILIVGENLWRSAVVTIGSVRSKQISVLPNMKGIVAKFWSDELATAVPDDISKPAVLRVWTSEGVARRTVFWKNRINQPLSD